MARKLFLAFFVCLFSSILTTPVKAAGEFSTNYDIIYTVKSSGVTSALYNISLNNRLSNIYATEFSLSIGSTQIKNIRAYNQKDTLDTQVNYGNKTTNITVVLKDKVVGKNKSNQFTLEFDSHDFANKLGSVWEISVPKLAKTEDLETYQLKLVIPHSLGEPAFISPLPTTRVNQSFQTIYQFKQQDLLEKGISATFGQAQYFNFNLTYHLQNSNVYPVKTEIALPPDSSLQKVIYQTIEPYPEAITVDEDGNWLAIYRLAPRQTLSVIATGSAEIHLSSRPEFSLQSLESDQAHLLDETYLKEQKYWEINNPRIQQLAQQFSTVKEIYQYVVDNLIYDYGRLGETTTRYGAANALDNQESAICTEFTDLFVALARAANIPARAVNGYAYTTNTALRPLSLKKDVLHAWPEYYDAHKKKWIPVDPTWSNTTGGIDYFNQLDLNHFSFVFLGQNSDYPIPAGAYKLDHQQDKDVNIEFGSDIKPQEQIALEIKLPHRSVSGLPINGSLEIKNTGNVAVYNLVIGLTSQQLEFSDSQWQIPVLPPFASRTIDINIPVTAWNSNFSDTITAKSKYGLIEHQLELVPIYSFFFFQPLIFQLTGGALALLAFWFAHKLVLKYSR